MSKLVLLLAGKKYSGKSTMAKALKNALNNAGIGADILSFAYPFKKLLVDGGVITHIQAFGSDADKNTLTLVKASDMPDFIQQKYSLDPRSFLTARQVMQYFGNDICKMFAKNIWVNTMVTKIKESDKDSILIDDFRFFGLENNLNPFDSKTCYLERVGINSMDSHESENAVRADQCDLVIHVDHNDIDNLPQNVEKVYNFIRDNSCIE